MKIDISTVHANMHSEHSNISLGWSDTEGNRYHVWFNPKTRTRVDDTIYKNPKRGVTYEGPGYFRTRYLDVNGKANMVAFTQALTIANDNKLFDKAEDKVRAERELELQQHKEAVRKQRIEKAGPALLVALKALTVKMPRAIGYNTTGSTGLLYNEYKQALAAIAEAEAE